MLQYAMEQIQALLAIPSPTGYAAKVTDYLVKTLTDMGFKPEKTRKGTVVCTLGGEGHPLLLSAHVDTLGAMVRSIKPNGRLAYTQIGGWQDATVETENCTIHTRDGRSYSGSARSHSLVCADLSFPQQ